MLQARLNHLAILNTHKERLDKLCLASAANSFVSLNENRQRNFGKFDTAELTLAWPKARDVRLGTSQEQPYWSCYIPYSRIFR